MATEELNLQSEARLTAALERIERALACADPSPQALQGPDLHLFAAAGLSGLSEAMTSPLRLLQLQLSRLTQLVDAMLAAKAAQGRAVHLRQEPWFVLLRTLWKDSARSVYEALEGVEGLPAPDKARLLYFAEQMVEFLNPANFLASNPDALAKLLASQGASWIAGLEYLAEDLERGRGEALPKLSSEAEFALGEGVALSEGEVVLRRPLFELLHYRPRTKRTHHWPLVIFPPWINKFYILDLSRDNSFVAWALDQGIEVFLVSWVNPGPSLRAKGLTAYLEEGYLPALAAVREICGVRQVNALGYCVAGTGLVATLALLQARQKHWIASATLLTTMSDFSSQGQFAPYLGEDFRKGIKAEAQKRGLLPARYLTRTFAALRPRALIYGPAQKRYLMGEAPAAFDLLHWNGDGTNLTAQMAEDLIEGLWSQNALRQGQMKVGATVLDPAQNRVPIFALACEADHIAPWAECYKSLHALGGARQFVLAGSGHVAGVIHPPARARYGYRTAQALPQDPAQWQASSEAHSGSWWTAWAEWLQPHLGPKRAPRLPQPQGLGRAPGRYVRQDAWTAQ